MLDSEPLISKRELKCEFFVYLSLLLFLPDNCQNAGQIYNAGVPRDHTVKCVCVPRDVGHLASIMC